MTAALAASAGQNWPPFVLVAGLLLIGRAVERDGLFEALGARAEAAAGSAAMLLAGLLTVEAAVAAVLNLDTAAVFLTPIIVHAARRRGVTMHAFVVGALLMANAASLLLPGSNLMNLIVLAHEPLTGAQVARSMLLPWLACVALTTGFLLLRYRPRGRTAQRVWLPPMHLGPGAAATAAATVLLLALRNPALPVLALGLAAALAARRPPRIPVVVPAALFAVAVVLGTLAREWNGPARLLHHHGAAFSAVAGAVAAVGLNNLPAAALLSAQPPDHPLALLLGLDLGPNLLVTGSLASYLWYHAACGAGIRPSLRRVTADGLLLVPLTLAAGLLALRAGL